MEKLKNSSKKIQDALNEYNLGLKVVEFSKLTRTSQEAAESIGCEVGQIAKTLIFKGKNTGKAICIIASGKNRVDEKKIVQLLGEPIEKPNADFVLEQTGFAIGGVPPIGYELDFRPYIGKQLLPKGRSFMVSELLPPACGLQRTLRDLRIAQTYRVFDLHSSQHAVGFHTNI